MAEARTKTSVRSKSNPTAEQELPSLADLGRDARYFYAYSFDRETWRGRFPNRAQAVEAAETALPDFPAVAEAIFVGRRVDPNLYVHGYAPMLLEAMREQACKAGDQPVDHNGLSPRVRDDLEHSIAQTLRDWLIRHELVPPGRIEEISEHPLPLIRHVADNDQAEVCLLGVEG